MPKQIRTRPVTPQQARAYLGKAEEYLEAAVVELDAGRSIAAASLAVHAGSNARDAVTGMRLAQRAALERALAAASVPTGRGDPGR